MYGRTLSVRALSSSAMVTTVVLLLVWTSAFVALYSPKVRASSSVSYIRSLRILTVTCLVPSSPAAQVSVLMGTSKSRSLHRGPPYTAGS